MKFSNSFKYHYLLNSYHILVEVYNQATESISKRICRAGQNFFSFSDNCRLEFLKNQQKDFKTDNDKFFLISILLYPDILSGR